MTEQKHRKVTSGGQKQTKMENKKENLEKKVWKMEFFQRKVGEMLFDRTIEAEESALNFLNSKNLSPENVKVAYRKDYRNIDVVAIYYKE